jgi:signal transduction histidine kinase
LPPTAGSGGGDGRFVSALIKIPEARRAVLRLYILTAVALLAVYALVAAALELFVLPQHVYGPIGRMLEADRAVQEGNKEEEIIPDAVIPADELGEIMRSRNNSILAIRRHEQAVAQAVGQLETVATDLKRKNHLLEAARRNLADADRLASLGMMSAGIAHELNTPLAVLKGLVEKLNSTHSKSLSPAEAALMLRVVRRLERLGDSLLDFARVRPPQTAPVLVRTIVDEALTLVRLDRQTGDADLINEVPESLVAECDGDRMVLVLVNLVRNGVDAARSSRRRPAPADLIDNTVLPFPRPERADEAPPPARPLAEGAGGTGSPSPRPQIVVRAETSLRDHQDWVSITITDNGPGIDPDTLSKLFEPFVSTHLDAHGTGLGLAVAEGIVREHGGLILARNNPANRTDGGGAGATFEIMLPRTPSRAAHDAAGLAAQGSGLGTPAEYAPPVPADART